jgi:hypothetical protein
VSHLEPQGNVRGIVFWGHAGARGVPHRAPHPGAKRWGENGHSKPHTGQQRKLGEPLRDTDAERIERTERAADTSSTKTHGHDRQRIEADSPGEQEQHGNERNDLLPHAFNRTARSEQQRDDRNNCHGSVPESIGQPMNGTSEGARAIDHAKRTACQKD